MPRVQIEYGCPTIWALELPIRITDINYGRHLAHDRLVSLMHEARMQFFRHFEMQEYDVAGCQVIIADLAVSYRAEAFYGDVLQIEMGLADFSRKGCDMLYRITDGSSDKVVAIAKTGLVFFDPKAGQLAAVPEVIQQMAGA